MDEHAPYHPYVLFCWISEAFTANGECSIVCDLSLISRQLGRALRVAQFRAPVMTQMTLKLLPAPIDMLLRHIG